MAKTEKIFDMLQIIRENPGVYNAKELSELCDISERGIFRYRISLANAGVTIRSGYQRKLFSIGLKYQADLDNKNLERLRSEFAKHGIILSQSATVLTIEKKDGEWQIDNGQVYIIRKRVGKLSVCKRGGYELLGPYWKKVLGEIDPEERDAIKALVEVGMETCTDDQVLKHGKELLRLLDGRVSKWQST